MHRLFIVLGFITLLSFSDDHTTTRNRSSGGTEAKEENNGCTQFQIKEARAAILAIDASNPFWALDGFMSNSTSARCPTIGSYCFANCAGKNTANANSCTSVCKLSQQPADCSSEPQLEAAGLAMDACGRAGNAWACLDAFVIHGNKVAFCPGVPERCVRICAQRHPSSHDCARVCMKAPLKLTVNPPPAVRTRPKPVRPPRPIVKETPVDYCKKIKDPIACDNDKLCYLIGSGIVRRGLGPPAYACCAKGYSKECEKLIQNR